MIWVDIIVIAMAVFSGLLSLIRGFSREVISIFSWIMAAYLAYIFYKPVSLLTSQLIHSHNLAKLLAASATFITSFVIMSILTLRISEWILSSHIAPIDRVAGLIYGVARGLLICSLIVFILSNMISNKNSKLWLTEAKSYNLLDNIGNTIYSAIPEDFLDLDKIFLSIKNKVENKQNTEDITPTNNDKTQ